MYEDQLSSRSQRNNHFSSLDFPAGANLGPSFCKRSKGLLLLGLDLTEQYKFQLDLENSQDRTKRDCYEDVNLTARLETIVSSNSSTLNNLGFESLKVSYTCVDSVLPGNRVHEVLQEILNGIGGRHFGINKTLNVGKR